MCHKKYAIFRIFTNFDDISIIKIHRTIILFKNNEKFVLFMTLAGLKKMQNQSSKVDRRSFSEIF